MKYKPYSIFLPPYSHTSGGIKVMWGLYGALLAKGQIIHPNVKYNNEDFIAIYPEIVEGNPLGAKYVVRYILNEPGIMGAYDAEGKLINKSPTKFGKDDLIFVFSKMFNGKLRVKSDRLLFLPIIDTNIFYDQGRNRSKTAYFVGKGEDGKLHPKDSIKIDITLAQDQNRLADTLNECHTLYQYDMVSAMSEIARLCGSKVTLLQDIYSKFQYRNYEPGLNGISFGLDEDVPLSVSGFRTHYNSMKARFYKRLDKFIIDTQKL